MFIRSYRVLSLLLLNVLIVFSTSCVLYEGVPPYSPTPCNVNEYVQNEACVACPKGTLRLAGDAINKGDTMCSPVLCKENQRVSANTCVPCKAGEVNEEGDDASETDTLCNVVRCATNQRVENFQCVSCQTGTFNMAGDLANDADTQCDGLFCGENQYVKENACLKCGLGTKRDAGDDASGEDTECLPVLCEENQRVKDNSCEPCPAGTTSQAGADATGQDTMCQPVLCLENQYVKTNECLSCPKGSTRPAGDLANGADTQCSPVFCDFDQRVQSNTCTPCDGTSVNAPGDDATGQDTQCEPFAFSTVSAGYSHTCGVTTLGRVKCWGSNQSKQLGVDMFENVNRPVDVPGLFDVAMVSVGDEHTCAVLKSGKVACWGDHKDGKLGADLIEDTSIPVLVPGINNATKVTLGLNFSCALDGQEIKCWGSDILGQLGDKAESQSQTNPVKVESSSSFVDVDTGSRAGYTCGLTDTGQVECWGGITNRFSTNPRVRVSSHTPVVVNGVENVNSISVGIDHICVKLSRDIKCAGLNLSGQLGINDGSSKSFELKSVDTTKLFDSISVGASHTCGLSRLGAVSCWGENGSGQLGVGSTTQFEVPTGVSSLNSSVVSISAGSEYTCAIDNMGVVKCWGNNSSGVLGIGSTANALIPTEVAP